MSVYTSYHTSVKICFALGIEQILPEELRKSIPRSTAHAWKQKRESEYFGYQFAHKASKNLNQAEVIFNDKVKCERANGSAVCTFMSKTPCFRAKLILVWKSRNKDRNRFGIQEVKT